jgi:hypothetical protein
MALVEALRVDISSVDVDLDRRDAVLFGFPRRSGATYSSSRRATGPSYQTLLRSVTTATPAAGSPAR